MRWLAVLAILSLSGCINGASAVTLEFDMDAVRAYDERGEVACGDQARLELDTAGIRAGSVRIQASDGRGAIVFDEEYIASEGGQDARSLTGAAGNWDLRMWGSVEGQATASLFC